MTQPVTGAPHATPGTQGAPGAGGDPGFTAAVSAITDAFGDPTRRRIYLFVREHTGHARGAAALPEGVTASAVAAEVGVHPNVARHHLDKLAAGGYVEVVARTAGVSPGRRAGRPSKHYVAVPVDTAAELPPVRSDDLVLALLGQALARLPQPDAEAMAEEVGATYGQQLAAGLTGDALVAGQRSLRSAMQSVAAALTAHGFAARTGDGDKLRIINDHCPFGSLAIDHPVLCAVDRGLVRGMLTALYPGGVTLDVATESSRARGDAICTTAL